MRLRIAFDGDGVDVEDKIADAARAALRANGFKIEHEYSTKPNGKTISLIIEAIKQQ